MIWMAVIFIASTSLGSSEHTSRMFEPLLRWVKPDITAETTSFIHFLIRKTGHLSEYAVLGILIMRAVRRAVPQFTEAWARRALLIAWVGSTAYASTDELHQVFVDGRTPALGDVAIDSCGALAGALAVFAIWMLASPGFLRQPVPAAERAA